MTKVVQLDAEEQDRGRRHGHSPDPAHVIISANDMTIYGIHFTPDHLRRLWKRGLFPQPLQISEHRIGWRLADILKWIESRQPIETGQPARSRERA